MHNENRILAEAFIALRRISIRRILVARTTHFADECFLFNLHLKKMNFCYFLLKIINLLIKTKSDENVKVLWFETWYTHFPWFYIFLLFYIIPEQILTFYVSLCEINCIKVKTMIIVLNLFYVIICSSWLNIFLSRVNERKARGLVQQLILWILKDLILQYRGSHSLNGDPAL